MAAGYKHVKPMAKRVEVKGDVEPEFVRANDKMGTMDIIIYNRRNSWCIRRNKLRLSFVYIRISMNCESRSSLIIENSCRANRESESTKVNDLYIHIRLGLDFIANVILSYFQDGPCITTWYPHTLAQRWSYHFLIELLGVDTIIRSSMTWYHLISRFPRSRVGR
jgi:hypothetical protein